MLNALQIETTILPGGRIEIRASELVPGRRARVFVIIEEENAEKRRLSEILGDYPGGRLFKSVEEVDAYIREERDSWDR